MVQQITDSDFNQIIADNESVVVKFFADWCGTCKLFAPKFKRLSDDERYKKILFIEVNAEENPESRKIAGVTNLPFMATFSKGKLKEGLPTGKEDVVVSMLDILIE